MNTLFTHFLGGPTLFPLFADVALKSLLLLALAALLVLAQRKSSAAIRHLTWSVALLGAILLPLFSWLLPSLPVTALANWWPTFSTPPAAAAPAAITAPPENASATAPTVVFDAPLPVAQPASAKVAIPAVAPVAQKTVQTFNFTDFLLRYAGLIWLAGVGIAMLPLLVGSWQVWRLTRRCAKLDGPEWQSLVEESSTLLNLRRPILLLSSPGVALPMTWGAWRSVILLPEAAHDWTELRRRVVLRHELAHVQRWDWLTYTLAYIICAIYWFNPLAWYAARRMRFEREQACDDLVLRRDTLPSDYANELLQLAAGFTGRSLIDWATVPMARRSALEGRLLAILDKRRNRAGLTRIEMLGAVILAAAVIIPVAMMRAAIAPTDPAGNAPGQSPGDTTTSKTAADSSADAKTVPPMVSPRGIAVDKDGMVYVIDYSQYIVYKLSPSGQLSVLADQTHFPGMKWPSGLAVDQNKNVYVADPATNAIYKITPEGKVDRLVGDDIMAALFSRGMNSESSQLRLSFPTGVAVDTASNLYVADNYGFTVSKVTPDGNVSILAGTPGKSGATDGPTAQALFAKPRGVALGADGTLYVVDEGNENVRKIAPDGTVSTVAGSPDHVAGAQDGAGGQASFSSPRAVAVDAQGNVYVADTANRVIRKITPPNIVTTYAGQAGVAGYVDGSKETARFNGPRSVAVDSAGNVYVTDSIDADLNTNRAVVRKISPEGVVSTLYAATPPANTAANPSSTTWHGSMTIKPDGTGALSLSGQVAGSSTNLSFTTTASPSAALPAGTTKSVKLTSLDLKAWAPGPGVPTYAWGNGQRHSPTLKIGGQEFADGISMIANGPLYLNLAGGSDSFTATIGMDGIVSASGLAAPVFSVFRIFGDGKMLYESAPKQRGDAPEKISVGTKGVKSLALDVRTGADYKKGTMRDADWADATFAVSGAQPQAVPVPIIVDIPNNTPGQRGLVQAFIVAGNVQLIDQDGYTAPLARMQTFTEGNTLKAGPGAQALIVFSNGATLKVLENSTMKVELFRQESFDEQAEGTFLRLSRDPSRSNIVLDLLAGKIQGEVKKLNQLEDSTFIINTPKGPVKEYGGFELSADSMASVAPTAPTAAQSSSSEAMPVVWNGNFTQVKTAAAQTAAAPNAVNAAIAAPVKLSSLDLNAWGPSTRRNHNIKIGNQEFIDGVSMRVLGGEVYLKLDGGSELFTASIGLDNPYPDNGPSANQAVVFRVYGGGKVLYASSPIRQGDAPVKISVDVRDVKTLALGESPVGNFTGGNRFGDWADATLVVSGAKPQTEAAPVDISIQDPRYRNEIYTILPPGPDNPHVALVIPNPPGVAGAMTYIDIIPGKSLMLTEAVTQASKLIKQPTGLANITRKLSDGSIKSFKDVNWQAAMDGKAPDFPLEDGDVVIVF